MKTEALQENLTLLSLEQLGGYVGMPVFVETLANVSPGQSNLAQYRNYPKHEWDIFDGNIKLDSEYIKRNYYIPTFLLNTEEKNI
jgi:hypothetical protein